ncbi:MAG: S1 RNA-binding domain-containing protein [Actinomycetia bacterium]|nr:S1 RNA-binding domain-containing protein [Actinomycetes bacterium]
MDIQVGEIVEGKVVKITNFGAFIKLDGDLDGLIHISEIANKFVKDINEYLRVGDEVKTKVVAIKEGGRIDLSIKRLEDNPRPSRPQGRSRPGSNEFEKMLKSFMKNSEEKQSDIRKRRDSKKF